MDNIYERMSDDTEAKVQEIKEEGNIRKFYTGKTIFLTGSTGFIGKCLMEKLLRSLPELDKIYTLIRPKKQMSANERIDHYFKSSIFDKLRTIRPDFRQKVVPIVGDLALSDLGISPEDRRLIIERVNIIIHNAASVYFDEKISVLCQINGVATQKLLELAGECHNMMAFMYVSTAYSHCYRKHIEEEYYPPPGDLKMIEDIIRADTENAAGLSESVQNQLLNDQYPNTYTFTKAIAEGLVEQYGKRAAFPCGIYRPSLVTSTYKEPIISWCGNSNGPVYGYAAVALGIVHTLPMKVDPIVDIIPVDMTANALIAMTWDLATRGKPKEPNVYNFTSSDINPCYITRMRNHMNTFGLENPSMKSLWSYFIIPTDSLAAFYMLHILLHIIPAMFVDIFLMVQGKKPIIIKEIWKFNRWLPILVRFTNGNWKIKANSIIDVQTHMNSADRRDFDFDLRKIDWIPYLQTYWNGIRVHVLRDPMDTVPAAKKRMKKLNMLHNIIVYLFRLLVLYWIYKLACYIFNFQ